jgi:DNA-binding NtrC family response regulator
MEKHIVFVVDDEKDILDNYGDLLEPEYLYKGFNSPEDFLTYFDSKEALTPDLVITDLKMPKMDGIEMISRAQAKGLRFPFILLSGFLDKKTALKAFDLGAFKVLDKPPDFEQLFATIDQLMVEHDVQNVRLEIRHLTSQLRELYTSLRLIMSQYIPDEIIDRLVVDAPNGKVEKKMSFENLLEVLESRLEKLLTSERVLEEMRLNKLRPG